jgi:hypothetical protein
MAESAAADQDSKAPAPAAARICVAIITSVNNNPKQQEETIK